MSSQVHAPYHFVPLSKWIYMPDWAHQVSHDVPFKDGYSGVIEYTLTNKTPLCVGDKQLQSNGQPTLVKWARDPQGKLVIPGSSLKGMIRNVMEIATFGKFSGIDEGLFSNRDISSSDKPYAIKINNNQVISAWLKYDESKKSWSLTQCLFAKVKHRDISNSYGTKILNKDEATIKYKSFPLSKTIKCDFEIRKGGNNNKENINWATNLSEGKSEANIVFVNERIKGKGKPEDYEFSYCFYTPSQFNSKTYSGDALASKVSKMISAHQSNDGRQISYLLKNQHPELGIPVFALINKETNELDSIGLAKMPRILNTHSAESLADRHQQKARTSKHIFDLAELMLGTLRDNAMGLKSRVAFSDATNTLDKGVFESGNVTLNGPKASFQNAYLEQRGGKTETYDDTASTPQVAGWKRYPVRSAFKENKNESDNLKVQSKLELLNSHSEFKGRIIFHNLKPEELGCLLWCLNLGNDGSSSNLHSLGHGKPLGAGACGIEATVAQLRPNSADNPSFKDNELVTKFIETISTSYNQSKPDAWKNSPQVQHLLAFSELSVGDSLDLSYMELKEFKTAKNQGWKLPQIKRDGATIERTEALAPTLTESAIFGKGRLSALLDREDEKDIWFKSRETYRYQYEQKQRTDAEKAMAEQIASEQEAALERLSDDWKLVKELEFKMANAKTQQDEQEIIGLIDSALDYFLDNDCDHDAAQELLSLIRKSNFTKNKNKKKAAPRKEKVARFCNKYGLD